MPRKDKHKPRSIDYWRSTIQGVAGPEFSTAQVEAAAALAHKEDLNGTPCGAWHALWAQITNPAQPCPCYRCSRGK